MKATTIVIIIVVLAVTAGVFILLELHQTTEIDIDGQAQTVTVWAWTVGDMLAAAGIPVTEGDLISPLVEARLPADGKVKIERAS